MEEINGKKIMKKNINKDEKIDMEENEYTIKYAFTYPSSNNKTNIHARAVYQNKSKYFMEKGNI